MKGYLKKWNSEEMQWEQILGEILQRDYQIASCPEILRDAYGKPYLKDEKLHFNVSHSGDYLAIVISEQPVGVDIQIRKRIKEGMYRKVVQPKEQPLIGENREWDFLRLWSLKESFVKAEGKGLRIPMKDYWFAKENEEYFVNYGGQRMQWTFNIEETLLEDYVIAVCGMEKRGSLCSWKLEIL